MREPASGMTGQKNTGLKSIILEARLKAANVEADEPNQRRTTGGSTRRREYETHPARRRQLRRFGLEPEKQHRDKHN
jgi:hypothetical protein